MSLVDDLSNESLLQALADGAMWALEALYQRYSQKLYSLAYRMIGDQHIAEDLVQETFIAVWQHAASYRPQSGPVRSWLFSIAHHQTIDALRTLRRRSNIEVPPDENEIEQEDTTSPDICEQVSHSMLCTQVCEAVKKLSKEQRMVIAMAYFQGWTHTEIAERLQLPLGTVKARIRLGLRHLKHIFERNGMGEMTLPDTSHSVENKPGQAVEASSF